MKMISLLVVLISAFCLGGCADQSLVSDEEYNASQSPAGYAPDPTGHVPQPTDHGRSLGNR